MDRAIAIAWTAVVAVVLAVLVLAPGIFESDDKPSTNAGNQTAAAPDGKKIFSANCAGCHTLAAADTNGKVGPNLDELKPDAATVKNIVTNGGGGMPSFDGDLDDAEIAAVAEFVSTSAGQ